MTLLKIIVLALSLGLLSNTSIATNEAYDNEHFDSTRSTTAKQLKPEYSEDQIQELQKMVFSGEPLLNTGSYLGRQETGRLQQVSKRISSFFNQEKESLHLWKGYAQQLQLEVANDIKVKDLISQIKNYYNFKINLLIDLEYRHHLCFIHDNMAFFNLKRYLFAEWTIDGKNSYRKIAGDPKLLSLFNNGFSSMATAISADGQVISGWEKDGKNSYRKTAVIWNWQGIVLLNDCQFKQSHDYLCTVSKVSKNGSDFIVRSETEKSYEAHVPRYDLWNMKQDQKAI